VLKTNAAVWYNVICKKCQLAPKYVNIKVKVSKKRYENTKISTVRHKLKQQITFLFIKYYGNLVGIKGNN
jgi:hypothetical protein